MIAIQPTTVSEIACSYAALILYDDKIPITAEKISLLVKAANVSVESYWPGLIAKLAEKRDLGDIILSAGSGGGGGAVAVAAPAAGAGGGAAAAAAPAEEKKDMADFCTRVASQAILNQIKDDCNKNLVVSPLALKCMLNMVGSGSTGQTLEQILAFLDSKSLSDLNLHSLTLIDLVSMTKADSNEQPGKFIESESESEEDFVSCHEGPVLSFVSGVWIDFRLRMNPSFERTAREVYRADAREVDFESQAEQVREEVNSWAEKETRGLIKDFLPQGFCDDVTLLLANALYFKGAWLYPFESSRNQDRIFYRLDGSSVKVPFMTKDTTYECFGSFPGFKILKLPYKTSPPPDSRKFSMYFFLPDATDGLQGLIQELNSNPGSLRSALQYVRLSRIWVPKFKFPYEFAASKILQEMGLTLPFSADAELKGMIDDSSALPYKRSERKMMQKCFIDVNEDGTEAAACTEFDDDMGMSMIDDEEPLPCFVADHPFLFLIKEEVSESVIFSGAILNPLP